MTSFYSGLHYLHYSYLNVYLYCREGLALFKFITNTFEHFIITL